MDAVIRNLPYLLAGLPYTFAIAGLSIVGSFMLGTILALGRLSRRRWLRYPAVVYIEAVRSIPMIIFVLYFYFTFAGLGIDISPFWAGVLALTVFASSYVAEVVRGGISAVPIGQTEAARASGLSHVSTLRLIVLPQAFRSMSPALVSEFVKLVKDSSLVAVIGVYEFFNRINLVNSRLLTESFALYGFAAVVYFVINYSLSTVARRMESRADV